MSDTLTLFPAKLMKRITHCAKLSFSYAIY